MIIIEMILLWWIVLCCIGMLNRIKQGDVTVPSALILVSLITIYVTLIRYPIVIKDSVVFG